MNKLVLTAVLAVVLLFSITTVIFATSGEQGWSRTTTQEATASFSIKHAPDLYTQGTISVSHSIRSSSTVGAEVLDTVQVDGELVRCGANGCTTIWTFSGERDISSTSLLQVNAGSLKLSGGLEITVQINDEELSSFAVSVPLTAAWTTTSDQNLCGEAAGSALGAATLQPAAFTGNLAGYKLNQIAAQVIQSDTVYGKSLLGGSCA